mmetsp:Transcript_49736/g.105916  ORF Transcript_49736/g.105916 Transcript_49736/m.105916 type:complete len:106 (+) Transcript_49736:267-584(+)
MSATNKTTKVRSEETGLACLLESKRYNWGGSLPIANQNNNYHGWNHTRTKRERHASARSSQENSLWRSGRREKSITRGSRLAPLLLLLQRLPSTLQSLPVLCSAP